MKLVFYANGSAGNHGCEALNRSFHDILHQLGETLFMSPNIKEDTQYHLNQRLRLSSLVSDINKKSLSYILYALKQRISYNDLNYYKILYRDFIHSINENDLYLSIGGDNYSYEKCDWLTYINRQIQKKGGKSILLGCSILENINDPLLIQELSTYKCIVARESLTYKALTSTHIKADLHLIPDPAFILKRKDLPLPHSFIESQTVGINISPLIINHEAHNGITMENYINLIEQILERTDMNIALIPHVVWPQNNDLVPLTNLYNLFKGSNRIALISDCTAEELKGFIARCRFMLAARTHASIAAYSEQIPTLVIGYSVKAKGIATDLFGTSQDFVIPVQHLSKKDDLSQAFSFLLRNEKDIKKHYQRIMPVYRQKVYDYNRIVQLYG